jgi:hypothetical protein
MRRGECRLVFLYPAGICVFGELSAHPTEEDEPGRRDSESCASDRDRSHGNRVPVTAVVDGGVHGSILKLYYVPEAGCSNDACDQSDQNELDELHLQGYLHVELSGPSAHPISLFDGMTLSS